MFVADAHCDYLYKIVLENASDATVSPESVKRGNIRRQVFAAFVDAGRAKENTQAFYARQIAAFSEERRKFCETLPDFDAILAVEGGEAIGGSIEKLDEFSQSGVRILTLTWNYENEFGFPHKIDRGLKPFGKKALHALKRLHIAADVSHLSEAGFWDVYDHSETFMASHSCAKALCAHSRNLTDAQIRAIIARRGFIGVNFNPPFLKDDGKATLADVCDHILHLLDLGGADVVGFGSDFDGIASTPQGLSSPADFPALLEQLRARDLDETLIEKIALRNFERFMGGL